MVGALVCPSEKFLSARCLDGNAVSGDFHGVLWVSVLGLGT